MPKHACKRCGEEFRTNMNRSIYCSSFCYQASRTVARKKLICKQCGKEFVPGRLTMSYCSQLCYHEARKDSSNEFTCPYCGKLFRGTGQRTYCSRSCRNKGESSKPKVTHACKCCGKEFEEVPSKDRIFCSHKCSIIWYRSPDHKSSTLEKKKASCKKWTDKNRGKVNAAAKRRRDRNKNNLEYKTKRRRCIAQGLVKLRHEVIMAYGGYSCLCDHGGEPCGPKPSEFLCIDHINGRNKAKGSARGGYHHYRKLRRENFPPGYRVLCHNCNAALGFYGYCPMSKTESQDIGRVSSLRLVSMKEVVGGR